MSLVGVVDRVEALREYVQAAQGYLGERELAPAEDLVARAGERLSLSRGHTVVALAGSTGTGKSSIFNLLAGVPLSSVGVRRPTTGETHACVWGADDAGRLLDWLGVGKRHRREAGSLDGLVLLDLPDFDSVQVSHREEADRLLAVADLIVWVLHPQKYADKLVHGDYLARFHRHREITVVVLNQADLLSPEDLRVCVDDLRRLLDADGLTGVPVLTTSTVKEPGLQALSGTLARAVAARQAALRRLLADLEGVVADLEVGPAVSPVSLLDGRLVDALAKAAGVPVVADATRKAYVHRARKVTGWPPLRWIRRMRPDPLGRLHLGESVTAATSIGPASPAAMAGVSLALRDTAGQLGEPLPTPWREPLLSAVRSKVDDLPDALDQAVARTDLGVARTKRWWRAVGALQWLAVAVTLAGLLWLAVRYVMFALALPEPPMPHAGRVPLPTALLAGGLLASLVIALLVRPVVSIAARRAGRKVGKRLRAAVERVARDLIVTPASEVIQTYSRCREALQRARG
ncbi:MAG TPA: GTPase [Candidatus Limnocylindrales bacterium]|nr:GTPase [Candidatus Limnocylindrales bacterium]